jgi:anti-sigma regulatory factor (Ser/Thr protein kinase)
MKRPQHIVIALRNELAELGRVNHLVEGFAQQHQLPPQLVLDCTLALDEVLTNIISYGFRDSEAHEIIVRISVDDGAISLTVEDDGVAFDPLAVPPPDLNAAATERPIGGLGMHLVRTLMPHLEYRRQDERNLLTMRRRIDEQA